jgi:hypothetical protein
VFNNISVDAEAIDYCLKQGLDPNFDNSLPIRKTCKGSYRSPNDIGEGYFDSFLLLLKNGAKLNDEIVRWAAEFKRINFLEHMINIGYKTGYKEAMMWVKNSRKLNNKDREEVVKYLKEKIKEL